MSDADTPADFQALLDTARSPGLNVWATRGALLLGLSLAASSGLRLWLDHREQRELAASTQASLLRSVNLVRAMPAPAVRSVQLPATLRGYQESAIYARSSAYVSAWHQNIGAAVRRGELLATLSAPEQEQELAQARAAREQVRARVKLLQSSLTRLEAQLAIGAVAAQLTDEKRSELEQAHADLAAADANIARLQALLAQLRILAPYDGVITRRSIEVGALVTPGSGELFAIAQTRPLRATVWVPQAYAQNIRAGQAVQLQLREFPEQLFSAHIEHASGAIDANTRSRQVDILLANEDGRLLPGSYAQVQIELRDAQQALRVPSSALLFGVDGPQLALVDDEQRIEFRAVKLGRDLGKEIEIIGGLRAEDRIVANPSDLLQAGETVQIRRETPAATPKPARGAS